MKAFSTFAVPLRVPDSLSPLLELATNLRWSWDDRAQDLFRGLDPEAWDARRDPLDLLRRLGPDRLERLATDNGFLTHVGDVHAELQRHLEADLWFQGRKSELHSVAYFSPEFGIAESVPQYSGGLGVLAGDHLKSSSGLGLPLIGVGLFYKRGYFRQELAVDGWQRERYNELDADLIGLTRCEGVVVEVDTGDGPMRAQVWRAQVGRIPLFMLDTDIDGNDDATRSVTDELYGGDTEHRLRQEILLGMGGVRALEILGESPNVFHTNEGHAGFLGLERIRRRILDDGLSFPEAIEAVRAGTVFTTHTPVPAGIDRFPRELMERHFKGWADDCNVPFDELMALGHNPGEPPGAPFNMAVMGMRLAAASNGVSRLHGEVSRRMFAGLWPGIPAVEVPIGSITNGVHAHSWVSPEMRSLLNRHVGADWAREDADRWSRIDDAGDAELWDARNLARSRMVAFVRRRLGLRDTLDPGVLTIGFARRFATYKRATLLLSQPDRLAELLLSADRPVQLVFAGKAHPADDAGKAMIRDVVSLASRRDLRHRMVFVPDYDIGVARALCQGSDLWLNTPLRPMEASGTSGMKAAFNGALNCSVLDGWWAECYDGRNGWAIPSASGADDVESAGDPHNGHSRDEFEASALFDLLEREIVPLFYDRRDSASPPAGWLNRVRASLRSLGWFVPASRMVRDYASELYEPAAARNGMMTGSDYDAARSLAAWKAKLRTEWHGIRIDSVQSQPATPQLGETCTVAVSVNLGGLEPEDVTVELLHGSAGDSSELLAPAVEPMVLADGVWRASWAPETSGRQGFTVRVVPSHPHLPSFGELGLVTWAES
ncbi:MAG TPA: alpha-glucan family phosphorylase [Acidimicrobiales bacterium]|nr:alpha-glucan family phosphorylase [Acidimicrobiales bacterium]